LLTRGAAFDCPHAPVSPTSTELTEIWRPWAETAVETFGADRWMVETNFPADKMGTGYPNLWSCFARLAARASDVERAILSGGTALAVYGLS
jgi:predicted TIM-barrel fold metal-dependent hydrolase